MTVKYEKQPDTLRRFRLYASSREKSTPIPHRYYRWHKNAHEGVAGEMVWAKAGTTIEVVDIKRGVLLAQYTRNKKGILIHREPGDHQ